MLTPLTTTHLLPRATPESQGIASSRLLQFIEATRAIRELHSVMLLRHGHVVAEGWWTPYQAAQPHLMFSVSKSFTSSAVGLAVAEGALSLDDPVLSFFPDAAPPDGGELLAAMQVRHLLTMATGQAVDTWTHMIARPDGDWIAAFLSVPVLHAPGSHFVYNTGATYMLSAIVQRATGEKVIDFLRPRLFDPLGITSATWQESPQGITAGGIGLSITTEDLAKFGQLYLQKGHWQGRQVLPADWVEQATAFQVSNSSGVQPDWSQGYGYQFWRCRHGAYRGDGVFGQYCLVMPEQDAVLAITGGVDLFDMQQPLDLVWELLLPAMYPEPLPDDAPGQATLSAALSDLTLIPAQGRATTPLAPQISGRTYAIEANTLGIEAITLHGGADGWTLTIRSAAGEEAFPCGYGAWPPGQATHLFSQPLLFARSALSLSGAWTADETFTIIARLTETPYCHTLHCHFSGDDLLLESQINVSLESMAPLLLTGQAV